MSKELDHPRKGLIIIQNTDANECWKWRLVRYLYPADHHPARITKAEKDFAERHDFKDLKLLVKNTDIHKIEKKNSIAICVLDYENKVKDPTFI